MREDDILLLIDVPIDFVPAVIPLNQIYDALRETWLEATTRCHALALAPETAFLTNFPVKLVGRERV